MITFKFKLTDRERLTVGMATISWNLVFIPYDSYTGLVIDRKAAALNRCSICIPVVELFWEQIKIVTTAAAESELD